MSEGEREDGGSGPLTKGMNTREANNPLTISLFTVLTMSYFLILTSDGLDVNFLSSRAVTSTEPHMAHGARKLKKLKKKKRSLRIHPVEYLAQVTELPVFSCLSLGRGST